MIPVFIVIGMTTAIAIFISPLFGLALTFILIPISTQLTMGGSFLGIFSMVTPIKIIGSLTFLSTLVRYGSSKGTWGFIKKPQVRFFLFFLAWIFFSGFAQPGFATRENFTAFISNSILGITVLILIKNIKRFRLLLWLIIISISFICIQTALSSLANVRAGGTGYGPNEFAIAILPFIAISFYMSLTEKNKILKFILVGSTAVIFMAMISTVSRGGIVGLAGMFLIAIFKSRKKIIAIILVCIVAAIFINTIPENLRERFSKTQITANGRGTGDGDIDSTTRRYYLAQAGWKIFLTHPLFGIGIGNYFYENRWYAPVHPGIAHCMYLEIMSELGAIGIILFLGIIFHTFKSLNRIIKANNIFSGYARGFYIGLVGFLIAGIFLHAQQDRILWFLIFMSAALENIAFPKIEQQKVKKND